MTITERTELCKADCCPILHPYEVCDELDFRYRLPFRRTVHGQEVLVVVTLRFRLERCSGPLTLGNLLYTTTLLPGEQVRLLTTDRNSRFSFNEATQAQGEEYNTSQESFFLAGMADSMSNLSVLENASDQTRFRSQLRQVRLPRRPAPGPGGHRRLGVGHLLRRGRGPEVRGLAVGARRDQQPSRRELGAGRERHLDHRGGQPQARRRAAGREVRGGVAGVLQPERLPRGDVPVLPARQDRDGALQAGGDRAQGVRPGAPERRDQAPLRESRGRRGLRQRRAGLVRHQEVRARRDRGRAAGRGDHQRRRPLHQGDRGDAQLGAGRAPAHAGRDRQGLPG